MRLRGGQVWMQVSLWKWTGGQLRGLGAGILDGLWTWKFKSHPGVALTKVESWTRKQAPKSSVKVGEWLWGPLITDVRKVQHATASQECERGKMWLETSREEPEEYSVTSWFGPTQKYKSEQSSLERDGGESKWIPPAVICPSIPSSLLQNRLTSPP